MELENVSYSYYNGNLILDQIDVQIGEKDFTVVFGDDDGGKTTLLYIIMGFLPLYQGTIRWDGDGFKKIRFIPDDIIWEKNMKVCQYMKYARRACPEYDEDMQLQLCEEFAIPMGTQLLGLTYRENKMVQIIAALCAKPNFLILDEPMNFLDSETYFKVLGMLQERNRKGMGIILATEKYADVKNFCSHYIYLKEARVIATGKVPVPDYRKKVVTVVGAKRNQIENSMKKIAVFEPGKCVYMYQGNIQGLPTILQDMEAEDFIVEDMTLEEELEMDFSRWEEQ